MGEKRLGDVIDDHCIKCRRVTNHSIVSLVEGEAAKVRCRTCYHDHDYRHEQAPPTKKELKKMEADALAAAEAAAAGQGELDGVVQSDENSGLALATDTSDAVLETESVPESPVARAALRSRRA